MASRDPRENALLGTSATSSSRAGTKRVREDGNGDSGRAESSSDSRRRAASTRSLGKELDVDRVENGRLVRELREHRSRVEELEAEV